ncbi:MAG: hypothetical protein LC754_11860 [Acidobacteria bacterium]|nr:hypothetical protein [Acidobacteriota bacterium]
MTSDFHTENLSEESFEESKNVKMSGLRVYFNPAGADTHRERGVFYSRREDGPLYRWRYDEARCQWRGSRVHPANLRLNLLSIASWKIVPTELQARLGEHYLE